MMVLGIESSCDETAAALVDGQRRIVANIVRAQLDDHRPFGGVVPEVAARAHVLCLDHLIRQAMELGQIDFNDLDAVAATAGPGLIGGLMVGLTTAKAIAAVHDLPLIAVNHLEAHALTPRLTDDLAFPYLLLLMSGGHCQLLIIESVGQYRRLGTTIDDAVGEAFDKAARMMGLGYPGGPAIEQAAADGDPDRFRLPRPLHGRPGCDFSFSGLKTALRQQIAALNGDQPQPNDIADLCASFQATVADVLIDRLRHAVAVFHAHHGAGGALVIAGGVAANSYLRARLADAAEALAMHLVAPPVALCTDNAAMVAWAGLERWRHGLNDGLDFPARARWPLDPTAVGIGGGVRA